MKSVILLASVLVFTLSGVGFAGPHEFGPVMGRGVMSIPPGNWWEHPKLSKDLSLSQEEKEKLEILNFEHQRRMIDLISRVQKEQLELEHLLRSTAVDAKTCLERFKQLQDARNALETERFKYHLVDIREMLGTERYLKLKPEVHEFRMDSKGDRRPARSNPMPCQ